MVLVRLHLKNFSTEKNYFVLADTPKTDQSAVIVVVGLAGILLGILFCLAVMFIKKRCVEEAKTRKMK